MRFQFQPAKKQLLCRLRDWQQYQRLHSFMTCTVITLTLDLVILLGWVQKPRSIIQAKASPLPICSDLSCIWRLLSYLSSTSSSWTNPVLSVFYHRLCFWDFWSFLLLTIVLKNNFSLRECCNRYISVLHQQSKSLKQPLILLPNKLCRNQDCPVKQIFLGFVTAIPQCCAAAVPSQGFQAKDFYRERNTRA